MLLMIWLDLKILSKCGNVIMKICLSASGAPEMSNDLCKDASHDIDLQVTYSELTSAIKDLDNNKSCGLDGIYAEHLKHCSDRILPLLSMCLTSLFIHGFLPDKMISVVLIPIVKNKSASICSKSNYRPIALASTISKILETNCI